MFSDNIKILDDVTKDFENVLKKKEKNCQTLHMIIKFREETIKRLETSKNGINQDERVVRFYF